MNIELVTQGLTLLVWLLAPIAGAALLAGVVASALQALFAWQDAALSVVPRVVAVVAAWALAAPWIADQLVAFAQLAWGAG